MSIVTKKGDDGTTGLLMGGRVYKNHQCIEAIGAIDELNAQIGICKAICTEKILFWDTDIVWNFLNETQLRLVQIMGELAVIESKREEWLQSNISKERLTEKDLEVLEATINCCEADKPSFKGWATPGTSMLSAQLDLATRVCRRAEREIVRLKEQSQCSHVLILKYINRLSDYLWLQARWAENVS